MILQDRAEPALMQVYLSQAVEVQVGAYNQYSDNAGPILPDYSLTGGPKLVGVSRKQCGELLSNLDACEDQLIRELSGPVEWLALVIEGAWRPDTQGCWAYQFDWDSVEPDRLYGNMVESRGRVHFTRRHYPVNWKHVQKWQARLEQKGVMVRHTADLYDTATFLIALHELAMESGDHDTLNRLIKQDISILALDAGEKAFGETLIGVRGAKVGPELALTIAALGFKTVGDLFRFWDGEGLLADTMVREKTGVRPRRIGTAAERTLQMALGYA